MIEGRCPRCGSCYIGWALRFPRNQMCSNCGAALEIYVDGKRVAEGFTPFTAQKHSLDLPYKPESIDKVWHNQGKHRQN
jgi:uncharacterized OB-fold protein